MNRIILKTEYKRNILNFIRFTTTIIQSETKALNILDMPHPKGLPIVGTKLDLFAAGSGIRLHEYIDNRHKQLGPIFYEKLSGNTKLVFISEPSLMKSLFLNLEGKYPTHMLPDPWVLYEKLYGCKRGLFFMNGEEWLTYRQKLNKHILKDSSDSWMVDPIRETIKKFMQNWITKAQNGQLEPNLESELYRLSTDVIVSILLGSNNLFQINTNRYDMILNMFSESVKKIFQTTTSLYGLPVEWFQRLNLKPWRDFKECVDLSIRLAQNLVHEMLTKRDENQGLIRRLCDENINDEIITRIVADFIIAAGDTTAYTTLWILHELSNNKDLVSELYTKDQTYTKFVVKEAMRLYPVAPFLTRVLPKESTLSHFRLEAGTPIIASIYTSGRDEQNFSKPDKFLPYRWDRKDPRRKDLAHYVPSASLPFALGARSCVGKKIAMMQMTELIHQIISNFELKLLNNNEVKPITSQVLIPSEEIKIRFSLRHKEDKY